MRCSASRELAGSLRISLATDTIAFTFPGQGSQHERMGEWLDLHAEGAAVFDQAEDAGFPARDICFLASETDLSRTEATQPALLTVSVATLAVLESRGVRCASVAGHSLGEYGALVAARVLAFGEALQAVRYRGKLMAEAGKGADAGMRAIIGLDAAELQRICSEASSGEGSTVVVANFNAPGQVVISGARGALERASQMARHAGARRVVPLAVSGAFHSPMMSAAQGAFATVIDGFEFRAPEVALYPNVTGVKEPEAERVRSLVVEQVTSPVRWEQTLTRMRADGVRHFVEVGPGMVLTGLVRRTCSDATAWTTHNEQSLEEVVDALAQG